METFIVEVFSTLWELTTEILSGVWSVVSKGLLFLLWASLALIILPCVFVAGHIYPVWSEWGEEF